MVTGSDVLDAGAGAGGEFRFLGEARSFPVAYGDAPTHDLSDYDAESDNPGLSDFVDACRDHPAQRFMEVGCGRRRRIHRRDDGDGKAMHTGKPTLRRNPCALPA